MEETKEHLLTEEEIISQLTLLDDDFMSLVFEEDLEATQLLLQNILERDDIIVTKSVGQKMMKSPDIEGRKVFLDILAKDTKGKRYNVEMQRADSGAIPKRARYHSAMLDVRSLKKNKKYNKLKDNYVIFITENDIYGEGQPIYHADRMIRETGQDFGDGAHIIYVNGAYDDTTTPIGKLIHDIRCQKSEDMHYEVLASRTRYFKETEEGKEEMCELIERYAKQQAELRAPAMAEEMAKKMAKSMAKSMAEETRINTLYNSVCQMVKNLGLSVTNAMDALDLNESDKQKIMKLL